MAFRALTLVLVRGRGDLFEFRLTMLTEKFVECHRSSILQELSGHASRQKFSCDIAYPNAYVL
jgi:hypothetical protein